jgi:putative transcriptional regulator
LDLSIGVFNRDIHYGWYRAATLDLSAANNGFWLADRQAIDGVERQMKNKLRVLRAERRWSQAMSADIANVSSQTIIVIETEKTDPSLPLAFKLAAIFGVAIEEIFKPEH